jgi:hypothetical protein
VDLPTVTIGKRTFRVLFPDLLRPLSEAERKRLAASVTKYGVRCPVTVDEEDGVIDGYNRLSIAASLGLKEVPTLVQRGLSPIDKLELALMLNDARRQLKPGERKEAARQRRSLTAELRKSGATWQEIGERTGVSHVQARADAAAVCKDLQTENVRVNGTDGKSYPPTRLRGEKVAERRCRVAEMHAQGVAVPVIAHRLGVCESTVRKDLKAPAAHGSAPAPPAALDQLLRLWKVASSDERTAFLTAIRAETVPPQGDRP